MAFNAKTFRESLARRIECRAAGTALFTLRESCGTSRGRDTYGYNIVSLYVDDDRAATCNGGGYDMGGTCLGEFIAKAWQPELIALAESDKAGCVYDEDSRTSVHPENRRGRFYGMTAYRKGGIIHRVRLDGACGESCMEDILRALGYARHYVTRCKRHTTIYTLSAVAPVTA